jgi:hypothetical protein
VGGWEPVAALAPDVPGTRDLGRNLWRWALGCVMVYSALFAVGKLLLRHWTSGSLLGAFNLANVARTRESRSCGRPMTPVSGKLHSKMFHREQRTSIQSGMGGPRRAGIHSD